jgi:hypothetical protein
VTHVPESYHVGTAFIQLLPSFKGFQAAARTEIGKIPDATVRLKPEIDTNAVRRELARATSGGGVDLTPTIDPAGVRKELTRATALAGRGATVDVAARVDGSALNRQLAAAARGGKATIRVDADTARAHAGLDAVQAHARRVSSTPVQVNMEAEDASRMIAMLGVITAGIGVIGAIAPGAAAAVALIPAALAAAAQGVSAIIAGFDGIGDAVKASQAVEDETATKADDAARRRVTAANRVSSAQDALRGALENVDRTSIQGAQQVLAARGALADTQERAAQRTADAERSLADTQRDARDAQLDLTLARANAVERIEDLRLALAATALDEEAAVLAVERAREKLDSHRTRGTTGLDMREIELAARQAEQTLAEVRERLGDVREQAAVSARAGVDGDREVLAAHRQLGDATQRVSDAEADLTQARRDGAKEVAAAQKQLAQAQQQAAWAQADAADRVAAAQRQIAEATVAAADTGSAAADKLALAMAKLTPAGRSFVGFIQGEMKPALRSIGDAVQTAMLPHMEAGLRQLLTLAPLVTKAMAETGAIIGHLAKSGADMMTSGPWRADFATLAGGNNRILLDMGEAGLSLADAFRNLLTAGQPMAERFFEWAREAADAWAEMIQGKRTSGELATAFTAMGERLRELADLAGDILGGFWKLAKVLAPIGLIVLNLVAGLVEMIGAFAEANPLLTQTIAVVVLATTMFLSLGRSVGGVFSAVRSSFTGYKLLTDRLRGVNPAADGASKALGDAATKTTAVGNAATATGGVLGRASASIGGVRDAYGKGAAAADGFASRVTTSAQQVASRLGMASTAATGSLNSFLPPSTVAANAVKGVGDATDTMNRQVSTKMPATAGVAANAFGSMSRAAGGVTAAVGTGMRSALGGVMGVLGGPWGLALTAAGVVLSVFAAKQVEAAQRAAEHKSVVQTLTGALRESNGVITEGVRAALRQAAEQKGLVTNVERLGIGWGRVSDAVTGGKPKVDALNTSLRTQFGTVLDGVKLDGKWRESLLRTYDIAQQSGEGFSKSSFLLGDYGAAMQKTTGATDEQRKAFESTIVQWIDARGELGHLTNEFGAAADAEDRVAAVLAKVTYEQQLGLTASDKLSTAFAGLRDTAGDVAERGQRIVEILDVLNGRTPDYEESVAGLNAKIRGLGDAMKGEDVKAKGWGESLVNADGTINTLTENGAKLRDTVTGVGRDMATSGQALFDSLIKQNVPAAVAIKQVNDKLAEQRQQLLDTKPFGVADAAMKRVLDTYGLVPQQITTLLALSGDDVTKTQLRNVFTLLQTLEPGTAIPITALSDTAFAVLDSLGYEIEHMKDGTFRLHGNPDPGQATLDAFLRANANHVLSSTLDVKTESAVAQLTNFTTWFHDTIKLAANLAVKPPAGRYVPNMDMPPSAGGATGALVTGFARGGLNVTPMSGRYAQIVPPNRPRLIGDRRRGPEAFIPIDNAPRSRAILSIAAAGMGFGLAPMAAGGVLGYAGGGVALNAAGGTVVDAPTPQQVAALTAAVDALTQASAVLGAALTTMLPTTLAPVAAEITTSTVPAVLGLADRLPVLHAAFTVTAGGITAAWSALTQAGVTAVGQAQTYLRTFADAITNIGTVFAYTADGVRESWSHIRGYAADPIRDVLTGPYNAGLVPAWNHLDSFFALGRPLGPVAVPFATGGRVPGAGNRDTVPALLTPGEYVISKPVVKKWGLDNIDAAHLAARRGNFPGLEGMLAGDDRGLFRVGYASGGPVPDALARAAAFGRTMNRKPYVWGGGSEAGTDCSGWMAMLARALNDIRPYARREWATGQVTAGNPPPRFTPGIGGTFAIGVNPGSHTAGTLAGLNVESGGSHGYVAYGPPSAGADHPQFPLHFHLPEIGGSFVSGGGGGFDLTGFIRSAFDQVTGMLADFRGRRGANTLAHGGVGLVGRGIDAIKGWATANITPTGTTGDVESWRPLVVQALRMLSLPPEWVGNTLRRMNQESGGDPGATNNWDVNAQRGDPSKGLMQVIGSTFRAYRDTRAPDDVFDPLANILASMKYAMSRYGSLPAAYDKPGGYDQGGWLPPGYSTVYNGTRRPEAVLTQGQLRAVAQPADNGGQFTGVLHLDSGELLGVVRGEIGRANDRTGLAVARRTR